MADAYLSPLFTWRSAIASKESGLPPVVRHVALTLSLHMSERGDSCFPGMELQAEETGLGLSTVRSALRHLADQGWLEREISHGRGKSNHYRALIPERYRQEIAVSLENRQETDVKPPPPGHEDDMRTTKRETANAVSRQPDELWDKLVQIIGTQPVTKSERGRWNHALKELREAQATPDQLNQVALAYRKAWPEMTVTPTALVANWTVLTANGTPTAELRNADLRARIKAHEEATHD